MLVELVPLAVALYLLQVAMSRAPPLQVPVEALLRCAVGLAQPEPAATFVCLQAPAPCHQLQQVLGLLALWAALLWMGRALAVRLRCRLGTAPKQVGKYPFQADAPPQVSAEV